MAILQRLKSLLGLDAGRDRRRNGEVQVTLEHEGSTDEDESTEVTAEEEPVTSAESPSPDTEESETTGEAVDTIDGIGPAYNERLASVGIDTVEELAESDPQSIASETDLSPARIERWIDRANERS